MSPKLPVVQCGGFHGHPPAPCEGATEPHTCPYNDELYPEDEPELCTCCDRAAQECSDDI